MAIKTVFSQYDEDTNQEVSYGSLAHLNYVRGATVPQPLLTLTDKSNQPIDLTDVLVKVQVRKQHSDSVLFERNCLTNTELRAEGKVKLVWLKGDLDLPEGVYEGHIIILHNEDEIEKIFDVFNFSVRN